VVVLLLTVLLLLLLQAAAFDPMHGLCIISCCRGGSLKGPAVQLTGRNGIALHTHRAGSTPGTAPYTARAYVKLATVDVAPNIHVRVPHEVTAHAADITAEACTTCNTYTLGFEALLSGSTAQECVPAAVCQVLAALSTAAMPAAIHGASPGAHLHAGLAAPWGPAQQHLIALQSQDQCPPTCRATRAWFETWTGQEHTSLL
jgi:hypothetical protein